MGPLRLLHLLNLDAVLVALTNAALLGGGAASARQMEALGLLALAVWAIYLTDRTLDGLAAPRAGQSERHAFSRRLLRVFLPLAALSALVALGLAWRLLPPRQFQVGLGLGGLVALYLLWRHAARNGASPGYFPAREALVGLGFAGGCALAASLTNPAAWLAAPWLAPPLACNCALIETWEQPDSALRVRWRRRLWTWLIVGACGLIALASVAGWPPPHVLATLVGSMALLGGLDTWGLRLSADDRAVLADWALILPALVGWAGS